MNTYETWGVVIPHSLGITIGLKQRVSCNDLIFQRTLHRVIIRLYKIYHQATINCDKEFWLTTQFYLYFACFYFLSRLSSSHCNCCKVLDDTLGVDSLSSTGFSTWELNYILTIYVVIMVPKNLLEKLCNTHVIRTDWFSRSRIQTYTLKLKLF